MSTEVRRQEELACRIAMGAVLLALFGVLAYRAIELAIVFVLGMDQVGANIGDALGEALTVAVEDCELMVLTIWELISRLIAVFWEVFGSLEASAACLSPLPLTA